MALRIWSHGSVIPDSFYDEADRLGILIWQDFYRPYTGENPEGRTQNLLEARHLIKRLRRHPGLVLWSGGNESLMFYSWAHEGQQMPGIEVFTKELYRVCQELDPSRPYLPESPYGGCDHNDPREWDTHCYTNYAYVPGYDYANFISEDFRISAPPLRSCLKFMEPEDIWPSGYQQIMLPETLCEVPDTWLKFCGTAESELKFGPLWEFYDAYDGESMIHRANMAASVFYQQTIERVRRGRPSGDKSGDRRCGGYLVWKCNDSWPQIYGTKIDYFGEPTMPFYFIKRAFAPVQISFDIGDAIHVWAVNDTSLPVEGLLSVHLFHITENRVKKEFNLPVSILPGQSIELADLTDIFQTFRRQNVLHAQLRDGQGNLLAESIQTVGVERYIKFPIATLSVTYQEEDHLLLVSTDQYAHCVYLEGEGKCSDDAFGWVFSDNYFSLLPGQVKKVYVDGPTHGHIRAREFYCSRRQ